MLPMGRIGNGLVIDGGGSGRKGQGAGTGKENIN